MTLLHQQDFDRLIDRLPADAEEVWLFEDYKTRRAAEERLATQGQQVRLHSAYKTLVCDVLEDGLLDGATSARIQYPVIPGTPEGRFLLECYPLHALFAGCDISFEPSLQQEQGIPCYHLDVTTADGNRQINVPVPVRWNKDADGTAQLASSGMLKTAAGTTPLDSEYEEIFSAFCSTLWQMPLTPLSPDEPDGPFFDRLEVHMRLPVQDEPLSIGHEVISLGEALCEEIYFTALEIFRERLGLGPEQRSVSPGQVVPRLSYGAPHLHIFTASGQADGEAACTRGCPALEASTHWLTPAQIQAHLDTVGGNAFSCMSRQGRAVAGRFVQGRGKAKLAISAGQHANESTPVPGALRAAKELAQAGDVSFTICPMENPDGYALFRELCEDNPRHMHHAARYTASGADLSEAEEHESAIRAIAWDHLHSQVHVNLHGYPSHEWTRPLSGYVPRGFAAYTLPKGFFLILRHHPGHEEIAHLVRDAALDGLMQVPELVAQNRRMLDLYRTYTGAPDFHIHEDTIPWVSAETTRETAPVMLITEAPDETIYGEDFRIAQEGQYRVVMAVAKALHDRMGV